MTVAKLKSFEDVSNEQVFADEALFRHDQASAPIALRDLGLGPCGFSQG